MRTKGLGILVLCSITLAGCGAAPKVTGPMQKWIVTSAAECVSMVGATESDCSTLIDTAVNVHSTSSSSYKSRRLCELTEGADRCERIEERVWRPRPQAFLIEKQGPKIEAKILYAGKDRQIVFRAADASTFDPDKPGNTEFSPTSIKRLEAFRS